MAPSIRQQLIDKVKARFAGLAAEAVLALPGGNYTVVNTFTNRVFIFRDRPLEDATAGRTAEPWFVTLADAASPKTAEGVEFGRHEHNLRVEADIVVRGGTSDQTARSLLADLTAAVGQDPRWDGLARWTAIEEDALIKSEEGQVLAAARLVLTITYRTALWRC